MKIEADQDVMTLTDVQHNDFIWTWKSNSRGSRVSLWLPYFDEAKKKPRTKHWLITYNGGTLELDLNQVDFIMFYGASGQISLEFLDALSQHGITLMIHRRNQTRPYIFCPQNISDDKDILSKQIVFRNNTIKRTYIAKVLAQCRFNSMKEYFEPMESTYKRLRLCRSIDEVRNIEAQVTARYWEQYYASLKLDCARREKTPLNMALDAGSYFLYGIILRWVLFHKLSPSHGYLHERTEYPSLIYDLIEPYRYFFENACHKAFERVGNNEDRLTALSLSYLKEDLEQTVYVPATRQYVRRKNLLHGAVLALRAYLLGEVPRLVLPVEGDKKGGRPPNVGYRLPGDQGKRM